MLTYLSIIYQVNKDRDKDSEHRPKSIKTVRGGLKELKTYSKNRPTHEPYGLVKASTSKKADETIVKVIGLISQQINEK